MANEHRKVQRPNVTFIHRGEFFTISYLNLRDVETGGGITTIPCGETGMWPYTPQEVPFQFKHPVYGNKQCSSFVEAGRPFSGDFSICTWNANGLFCHNIIDYGHKIRRLSNLISSFDVVFLQETHDNSVSDLRQLHGSILKEHCVFSNPGSSAAGGTIIVLKQKFAVLFCGWSHKIIGEGRFQILQLSGRNGNLDLNNCHSNPNNTLSKRSEELVIAWSFFRNVKHTLQICGGDFNAVLCPTDRMRVDNGEFVGICNMVSDTVLELTEDMVQFDLLEFTHKHTNAQGVKTFAVLDRFFASLPLESYAILNINTGCIGDLSSKEEISDHLPSFAVVSSRERNGCRPIPQFVAKNAAFGKFVQPRMQCFENSSTNHWERMHIYKGILKDEAGKIKNIARHRGAKTIEEKIFWAIKFLRVLRTHRWKESKICLEACPDLKHSAYTWKSEYPDTFQIAFVRGQLQEWLGIQDEESFKAKEEAMKDDEYKIQFPREKFLKKLSRHSPKNRKIGIGAVYDENDFPIIDKHAMADKLIEFWGNKASAVDHDEDFVNRVLKSCAVGFPVVAWILRWNVFRDILPYKKGSAPGPDGIP